MSDGTLGDARRKAEAARRRQEMLRDARELEVRCRALRRRSDRQCGRTLAARLSDPEPVDNESWFEFLLEHPELTGWAADK